MNESCRASRRWQAGYSLPEMLVVVAIIGLLAMVTIPSFVSYYQSQRVKSAMRNFTTDLRKMRALSANRGVQAKMSFATGAGARTYRLFYGSAAVGATQTWTAIGNGGFSSKSLESIVFFPANATATPQTFTDIDGDGTLDIIFLPSGAVVMPVDPNDNTKTLPVGTVTLQSNLQKLAFKQYQIDINPVGRVLATPK